MKKTLTSMLLLSLATIANAQQISQEEAQQIARDFWTSPVAAARSRQGASGNPVLAYTAGRDTERSFYVFNNTAADGFVIVAGDASAQQILGYSFQGSFDYATAPANLKWWLSQYENQIQKGIKLNKAEMAAGRSRVQMRAAAKRAGVEDIITTKWNQDAPFNNYVPQLPGASGDNLFPTGCVPTAMAQVMKHYNYPDTTGLGSNEYQKIYNDGADTIIFRADFASTSYKWEEMKDRYYPANDADAVSTLMYHCGVSVNADYGTIRNGGTSAYNIDIPKALINYFGYDKSIMNTSRKFYTDEEWENLIYAELVAGRPVIYGGQAESGGHAFIIHGYNEEKGTFAINWGWGGSYDGYYALTGSNALRPGGSGIGGAGNGSAYTMGQEAVIGIRPNVGGDYVWVMETTEQFTMGTSGDIASSIKSITIDKNEGDRSLYFTIPMLNTSVVPADFNIGLQFIDENSKKSKIVENIAQANDLAVNHGIAATRTINTALLEFDGTYKVYPVFRLASAESSEEWKRANIETTLEVPTIIIKNGSTPEMIDVSFKIGASAIKEEDNTSITWNDNYNGTVTYSVDKPELVSISRNGNSIVITGKTSGTATVTVNASANGYYNATERTFEITITEVPVVPVTMSISGTEVAIGESLQISHDPAYTGAMSYSCDTEGIVSIDENGKVTALAAGSVIITATAEGIRTAGDQFFTRTIEYFEVTVVSVPKDIYIVSIDVPNNGYFTTDGYKMNITMKNNYGADKELNLKIGMKIGNSESPTTYSGMIFPKDGVGVISLASQDYSMLPEQWNPFYRALQNGQTEVEIKIYLDNEPMQPTDKSSFILNLTEKLNVTASTAENGWGTVLLPFEATLPEGMKAYTCSTAENNLLVLNEVTTLSDPSDYESPVKLNMDTPYIIQGNGGSYTFTGPTIPNKMTTYTSGLLMGVTANDTVPQEAYMLGTRDGFTAFYKVDASEELPVAPAYTAFISLPEAGNINEGLYLNAEDAEKNGIEEITIDAIAGKRNGIFTIGGMKLRNDSNVSGLQRGLYIINGKKVSKQ